MLFCDHFLEFRFEYLWPFWLFIRSVYDSFKYQGLVSQEGEKRIDANSTSLSSLLQAFSVFFICIALTSDMLCFVFIPVNWLFFAASTYVWVQYVWHTGTTIPLSIAPRLSYVCFFSEKGICLPTLSLWFLLISVEGLLRWRDLKAPIDLKGLPFHLDLCRPFAAHW